MPHVDSVWSFESCWLSWNSLNFFQSCKVWNKSGLFSLCGDVKSSVINMDHSEKSCFFKWRRQFFSPPLGSEDFGTKYNLQCDHKKFDRMIKSIPNSVILMIKNALPQVADQPHLPSVMINEKDFSTKNLSDKTIESFHKLFIPSSVSYEPSLSCLWSIYVN